MVKNKPTPLAETERLLALVPFITANQGISVKELSAAFDVSPKQMVSDLTTLWMCGLPGYTALELMDLSFESGFVTIQNAETLQSPRTLNLEEQVALIMGLDLLSQSLPTDSALKQNIEILGQRLSKSSRITSKLRAISNIPASMRAEIETAIVRKHALDISYYSIYRDEISQRLVRPLELRVDENAEYLYAFCETSQDFRTFRLDRIQSCTSINKVSDEPPAMTDSAAAKQSFTVRFNSRLRVMKERFDAEEISSKSEYSFDSFSSQWLIRSILASAGSAELVTPLGLREKICEKSQLLLDRYQSQ
ncbi:unannotated protein [freshwater metagenome]|uniref:Unannotated protein n=1 Tax=freshwater metagenome TaxID=449393 RepID=A0A6J6VNU8_9ZZZZ|nr:WYL domain-containing protein [Actinomycetota bacterium]MTB05377.1 WYL domain-containing protein [Actinomycetota bacterium]